MGYQLLTKLIIAAHFAFLLYVVFGGFLAWRWPPLIWPHLVAAAWGAGIALGALECPLTDAENWARARAGSDIPTAGFIDRFVEGVLYPERFTGLLQMLAAVLVAVSWVGAYLRHRNAQPIVAHRETD
jgi:Protein of Unknown function (DUF2784)